MASHAHITHEHSEDTATVAVRGQPQYAHGEWEHLLPNRQQTGAK